MCPHVLQRQGQRSAGAARPYLSTRQSWHALCRPCMKPLHDGHTQSCSCGARVLARAWADPRYDGMCHCCVLLCARRPCSCTCEAADCPATSVPRLSMYRRRALLSTESNASNVALALVPAAMSNRRCSSSMSTGASNHQMASHRGKCSDNNYKLSGLLT